MATISCICPGAYALGVSLMLTVSDAARIRRNSTHLDSDSALCMTICMQLFAEPGLLLLGSQVVPILRAGLVPIELISTVLPSFETYHVGMVRDEATLQVSAPSHGAFSVQCLSGLSSQQVSYYQSCMITYAR